MDKQAVSVLIIEDERIVALDLQTKLRSLGYGVCAYGPSGEAALELVREHHPDVVLMDIMLEGTLDGIEAASKIREIADTPVVFLTAYTDEETRTRAFATNYCVFLAKPVDLANLDRAVREALNLTAPK